MSGINIGLSGHFKLIAVNADSGEERVVADWFDNLITNIGLNRIGTDSYGGYCFVGSGSTAPTVNDQVLATFVAETSNQIATEFGAATTAPYYGWERVKYRFEQGAAAGNISEIGVGWLDSSGGWPYPKKLFSRTLVKDGGGNPTTVTILPSEYLDVIHEVRMYAPTADVTGQITISGVVHDYILRACNVTNGQLGYWRPNRGNGVVPGTYAGVWAHPGDIGDVTGSPTGYESISVTSQPYVNNSNERLLTLVAGLDIANFAGGIRCLSFGGINTGMWQIQFTPKIAKNNTKVLNVTFKVTWARRP